MIAQSTATIRCEPSYIRGPATSNLALDIYLEDVVDLYGMDIDMAFDPATAQVVDTQPGTGWIETIRTFFDPGNVFQNSVDNGTGTILYASHDLYPDPPVTGSGSVARVTFSNVTPGTFVLHFSGATISTHFGVETDPIREDCTISFCEATSVAYVDDDYSLGSAGGHIWGCDAFDDIQDAVDVVTAPGVVHVYDGNYSPYSADKDLTLIGYDLPTIDAGGNDAVVISGGNVVMKGFQVENADTALALSAGTLTAYANNINSYTTALSNTGATFNGSHNWWGVHEVKPPSLDSMSWEARLGADIEDWSDGDLGATLGLASLSGGSSGTGVIVSHGRNFPDDAPFGNGIAPHADNMCSEYYDMFTVNASGSNWTASVPVDDNVDCNSYTRDEKRLYWVPDHSECYPSNNLACWDLIEPASVVINGQNLEATGLSVSDLGDTPFVAGDNGGSDPTAVTLRSFTTACRIDPSLFVWVGLGFVMIFLAGFVISRYKME